MFSSDYNILNSVVIRLKNFIQYNHCHVVQLFGLTPFLKSLHHNHTSFAFVLGFQTKVNASISSKLEQQLLQAFLVEMAFSMTAKVTITVEERRFYETHIAYRLALIHSTCSSNLQPEL